jgi:hypothetical protein
MNYKITGNTKCFNILFVCWHNIYIDIMEKILVYYHRIGSIAKAQGAFVLNDNNIGYP